jgi:hypothetical protein
MGYEILKNFGDNQYVQSIVDDAILSLLPVLFNSNLIQKFDFGDVSRLSLFMLEKIRNDNVCKLSLLE